MVFGGPRINTIKIDEGVVKLQIPEEEVSIFLNGHGSWYGKCGHYIQGCRCRHNSRIDLPINCQECDNISEDNWGVKFSSIKDKIYAAIKGNDKRYDLGIMDPAPLPKFSGRNIMAKEKEMTQEEEDEELINEARKVMISKVSDKLVTLANSLDLKGMSKEANVIDTFLTETFGACEECSRTFKTYEAWKKAVKQLDSDVLFRGDKDIDSAFKKNHYDAEWDGEVGTIELS